MMSVQSACLMIASLLLVAVAPSHGLLDWRAWRQNIGNPLKFCNPDCIHEVFADHCESMDCAPTPPTPETLEKLCVDTCILGLASSQMSRCLAKSFKKLNGDPTTFQHLLLNDAYEYCQGFIVAKEEIEAEASKESIIPFEEVYNVYETN